MNCFKKYDIRGVVGEDLTPDIVKNIAKALLKVVSAQSVVIGCDARESSPTLKQAMIEGFVEQGAKVFDIGTTGTEEIYFATMDFGVDLGVEITASHNPIDYNGIKFVGKNAKPFSDEQFLQVKQLSQHTFEKVAIKGNVQKVSNLESFCGHLLTYFDAELVKPLKIVTNAGNGVAGHVIDALELLFEKLGIPVTFIKLLNEPDSTFPNGIPNPLLPGDRWMTSEAVIKHGADFGVAWDGDFDRCFFFDEKGEFIEGYYIVGLLAQSFLLQSLGEKVIHDPRLTWNTRQIVSEAGGIPVVSKTGHVFIKQKMREEDAIYGGEMSAHHYFRKFGYCDSGMIPWLLVMELVSRKRCSLSSLVDDMRGNFPISGEINFKVKDAKECVDTVFSEFKSEAVLIDYLDGLSMEFDGWRFSLRSSNTEPLLRLNIESRGDASLVESKLNLISQLIEA